MPTLIIAGILFGLGIGLTMPLFKNREDAIISIFLAPTAGFALATLIGVFYVYYSIQLTTYLALSIIALLISLGSGWRCYQKKQPAAPVKTRNWTYIMAALLAVLIINHFLNPISGQHLSNKLSSDLPAYIKSSNFLLDGGVLPNANNHPYTKSILSTTFRWGLPSTTALLALALNTRAEYILFTAPLIIFTTGLFASVLLIIRSDHEKNARTSQLWLVAPFMALNPGLLYYLSEAFYPQIISISLVTGILALGLGLRKHIFKSPSPAYALITCMSAALFATYSESFIILGLSVVGILVLDIILRNKKTAPISLGLLACIAVSCLLIYPLIGKLIAFTLANSMNMANIGFPMPAKPLPSDWVGLTNIFSDTKYFLHDAVATQPVTNGRYPLWVSMLLSTWVLYVCARFISKCNNADRAFFLVPFIGIGGFFSANLYLVNVAHSTDTFYLYNKTVTLLIPLTSYVFFAQSMPRSRHPAFIATLMAFVISLTFFLRDVTTYRGTVDLRLIKYFQAHPELNEKYIYCFNERGNRNGVVIGKLRYVDRASEMILGSLTDAHMIDQWTVSKWTTTPDKIKNREIVLLVNKAYINPEKNSRLSTTPIFFTAGDYLALSTKTTLGNLVNSPPEDHYPNLSALFIR
jgi:hypothetical protein